jgi:hypothetical protein
MNLTDDKDAKLLYDIACELQNIYKQVLSPIDYARASYYIDRDKCKHKELEELYFDTPVDLRKYLEKLWEAEEEIEMRRFIPIILAAAFKRRPKKSDSKNEAIKTRDDELPDFVYNF